MLRALAALLIAALLAVCAGDAAEARPRPRAAARYPGAAGETLQVRDAAPEGASQGGYGGVTPESGEPPETKAPPPGMQAVTWPGFRAGASGAEVFLQLTGPVTYDQRVKPSRVELTLEKTVVLLRNNLRPVITRNFGGPVSSFRLRRVGGSKVRLEIKLRRPARPAVSMSNRGKFTFLVVAFPATASGNQ
jgi:hypothetical protein